jgi:hypothetical protein
MEARGESQLCPMLWRRGSGRGADQDSASKQDRLDSHTATWYVMQKQRR